MNTIGNLIWFLFGGVFMAIEYFIASLVLMLTIIGIPFGLQTFKLGILALWPFGYEARYTSPAPSGLSTIMNVIWFFIGGIWISVSHILFGFLFGITIIGIPFARQHFKLAGLALSPFGREIVKIRKND